MRKLRKPTRAIVSLCKKVKCLYSAHLMQGCSFALQETHMSTLMPSHGNPDRAVKPVILQKGVGSGLTRARLGQEKETQQANCTNVLVQNTSG